MKAHNGTDPALIEQGEQFIVRLLDTPQANAES